MDSINITTTQNVELEYEAAGVGYRILASLLDGVFMAVYIVILIIILGIGANGLIRSFENAPYFYTILMTILGLPILLYHFLSETFMNGQSFGKKIVGIQVIKLDGTQAGIGSYALRSVFRIIDISLLNGLVALITILLSDNSQRLGDMAAGTTVIRKGIRVSLNDTILYNQIPNYNMVFEQVALLSDKDIGIIKDILDHSLANNKMENLKLLATKVKTKMGVTTTLNDAHFLRTVLLDYSHYQFER